MKRRVHPMTALVAWLGVAVVALLLALVAVIARLPSDQQLDGAHTAGMHLGQQMCLGFLSEKDRAAARRQSGGLL
jgi:hypothetical protein